MLPLHVYLLIYIPDLNLTCKLDQCHNLASLICELAEPMLVGQGRMLISCSTGLSQFELSSFDLSLSLESDLVLRFKFGHIIILLAHFLLKSVWAFVFFLKSHYLSNKLLVWQVSNTLNHVVFCLLIKLLVILKSLLSLQSIEKNSLV